MTPSASPTTTRPCTQRQRRRLLLIGGGVMVPAIALGGVLVALPAQAQDFNQKHDLTTAFGQLQSGATETYTLQATATAASPGDDVQQVPAGTNVTIDLHGNDLALEQLKIGAGATLTIEDSGSAAGSLVVGAGSPMDAGITFQGGGSLVVDGADVTATGSTGNAGIGTATNGTGSQSVLIGGDAHVTATGGAGAAGIGGGSGLSGADVTISGDAQVSAAAGSTSGQHPASAVGAGEGGQELGSLVIGADAKLTAVTDLRVSPNATVANAGELALTGNLVGSGTVENTGSITGAGTIGADVTVTRNNYNVTVNQNEGSGSNAAGAHLYTSSFAAFSGVSAPTRTGYHFTGWKFAGRSALLTAAEIAATDLHDVAASTGAVEIVAQWSRDISVDQNRTHPYVQKDVAGPISLGIRGDGITVTKTSGTLPTGLALNANGTLTGTPTRAATSSFVVNIHSQFEDVTQAYQVSVGAAPAVTTTTVPLATIGHSYSTTIDSSGGGTVNLTSVDLPAGLVMTTDGTVTGTPTGAEGDIVFHVTATSEFGAVTAPLTLHLGAVPQVTTMSLPAVKLGQAYDQTLVASGRGTQTFSITAGALPAGLSLNASTGAITGTATGSAATASFTVGVETAYGHSTQAFSVPVGHAPSITTTMLDTVKIGVPYSASLAADGDDTKTFTVAQGALPSGLTLAANGTLSGTYSGTAVSATFTVNVHTTFGDDQKVYTVVAGAVPSITTTTLPVAKIGQVYTGGAAASGDGSQSFSLAQGTPPAGLTLQGDGSITGTPTGSAGDVVVRVRVETMFGSDEKNFTIHVGSVPAFTATTVDTWATGTAHSQSVPATGTDATYAITSGALPQGITLSSGGTLSGTVASHQNATFTVTASSIYGTASRQFTLRVGDAPRITTTRTAQATVGSYYESTLVTTGDELGNAQYGVAQGSLPDGLQLDASTGVISGYATAAGSSTFRVQVVTPFGNDSQQYTLRTGTAPTVATDSLPPIPVGGAYSADLSVSGTGGSSATYRITTGALPSGLSLNQATGHLSGTVSSVGETSFTITATTDFGTTQRAFTVTAGNVPAITTATSEVGVLPVGQAFSLQLAATGTGARTWTVASGTLPQGVTLSAAGLLSGTPTDAGSATVVVKAESIYGIDTKSYVLRTGTVPTVSTTSLPAITVGSAYSADVAAAGTGSGSATFAVTTGTLPQGLALNATTGHLSGTAQAAGDTTFTVTATTDFGTAARSFTVHAGIAPSISTQTIAVAPLNQQFTKTLVADGTGGKVWSLATGSTLPDGLTLSGSGVLSGTPTTAGSTNVVFKVTTDYGTDTRSYTIRTGAVANVTTITLDPITVGSAYSADVTATGTGPATFSVTTGALPLGLDLDHATGHISGTVQTAGETTFTVTATNDFGSGQKVYTVQAGVVPHVTSGSPTAIVVDQALTPVQLFADGTGPFTWSVTNGTLPQGLELSSAGVLSGTAVAAGSAAVTVRAHSVYGDDVKVLTLRTGIAPAVTTTELSDARIGASTAYSETLASTGSGTATFTVTAGSLPDGLTLDSATGVISGTVSDSAADSTFTVTVTTAFGTATKQLTIHAGTAPAVTTADVTTVVVGRAFTQQLAASGSTSDWSISAGALPAGLTLSSAGVLSGTATAAGDFDFTVQAHSRYGTDTKRYTGTVGSLPAIATQALPGATAGTAYSTQVAASGGSVSITHGTLPAGLAYNASTGVIAGTPSAAGRSTIVLTATNRYGSVERELTIVVAAAPAPVQTTAPAPTQSTAPAPKPIAAPVLPTVTPAKARFGLPYSVSFAASSTASVQYASQGHLPDGLTLNTYTGVLSGTPKAEGTFSFAITATNSGGSVGGLYQIVVPEQASLVTGSASTVTPEMGQPIDVKVAGLKKGERWTIKVDGKTVASGTAAKAGDVVQRIALAKTRKDHTYTVRVATSRTDDDPSTKAYDEFDVTAVAAKKSLTVKGTAALVTVTGLAPRERVSVSEGTKLVAEGRADADGTFTFVPKGLKAGKHKLVASGRLEDRTGAATVKIAK